MLAPVRVVTRTRTPPTQAPDPNKPRDLAGGTGSVYYQNCDAARAADAAPVYRGDLGYGAHLDHDGDGAACE